MIVFSGLLNLKIVTTFNRTFLPSEVNILMLLRAGTGRRALAVKMVKQKIQGYRRLVIEPLIALMPLNMTSHALAFVYDLLPRVLARRVSCRLVSSSQRALLKR